MCADLHGLFDRALEAKLGTPLEFGLANRTDFASRVLWPSQLAGQPMFRYEDIPPTGFWQRILGIRHDRQTYTEQVAAYLAAR